MVTWDKKFISVEDECIKIEDYLYSSYNLVLSLFTFNLLESSFHYHNNLTLKDLFPDLSGKTMYQKYVAPGRVQEFLPSTLIGLYLLKNGHTALYQRPRASKVMRLSSKLFVVMLSSLFCEKKWLRVSAKNFHFLRKI